MVFSGVRSPTPGEFLMTKFLSAPVTDVASVAPASGQSASASRWRPSRVLAFVSVIVGIVIVVAASPVSAHETSPEEVPIREITFPVVGSVSYEDTYGACRGIGCSRSHQGVDVFAPRLTPLVAAKGGTITSLRRSSATNAGNTVIIEDDEGWRYLYLHLNNDSPGTDDGSNPQGWIVPNRLRIGDRVEEGQFIGYLGDSGNAETTPPHLHFEIRPPSEGPINPTPSVLAAQHAGRLVPVSGVTSSAEAQAEHHEVVNAWYRALLRRGPTSEELTAWSDRLALGLGNNNDLIADLTMAPSRRDPAGSIYRAYHVVYERRPDLQEMRSWLGRFGDGTTTETMVAELFASSEWADARGGLSDGEFIGSIYESARGRQPTESVRAYWTEQLEGGRSRADMTSFFVDSVLLKGATWHELEVTQAFRAAADRLPTTAEYEQWVPHLDDGGQIVDVVDAIRG